jgi:hypothetical protein
MKKFLVNCIQISILGNKVANFGEEVNASQLAGDPNVLVKEGYIIEVENSDNENSDDENSDDDKLLTKSQLKQMSKSDIFEYSKKISVYCRDEDEGTQKEMIEDVLAHEPLLED